MWTKVTNQSALKAALKLARGSYQRNLLLGLENLSGSTLKGKARQYSSRYHRSGYNLLRRIKEAGITISEERAEHNRRILVIGS